MAIPITTNRRSIKSTSEILKLDSTELLSFENDTLTDTEVNSLTFQQTHFVNGVAQVKTMFLSSKLAGRSNIEH